MHDIEQPDLFGLTDAEKDRARRRVRKPYPKKKDKPVKSAAPGRTKAASEAKDVSAADELIDGVPQHVNTYHPDWMDEIGRAKNERLAAVLKTLAAEGAKPAPEETAEDSESEAEAPEDTPVSKEAPAGALASRGAATDKTKYDARTTATRYSRGIKNRAYIFFTRGWGYKATAGFLNLSGYTVREWKRRFQQGTFLPDLTDAERERIAQETSGNDQKPLTEKLSRIS